MESRSSVDRLSQHLSSVGARAVYELNLENGAWVAYAARSKPTNLGTSIRLGEGLTIELAAEQAMASMAPTSPRRSQNVNSA